MAADLGHHPYGAVWGRGMISDLVSACAALHRPRERLDGYFQLVCQTSDRPAFIFMLTHGIAHLGIGQGRRPADMLAPPLSRFHPGLGAVADLLALELG